MDCGDESVGSHQEDDPLKIRRSQDRDASDSRRIRYERLGTLRYKIPADYPPFNIREFRDRPYDMRVRD